MKKLILLLTIAVVVTECGMHNRISSLRDNHVSAGLALPQETFIPSLKNRQEEKDTIEVSEPENVLIMNAVKDENGEMTATDVIRAAMVTARFRNVAERHGKVDLKFQVVVPGELQDSRWQLRLYPDMFVMEDSIRLEPVVVTGAQYRRRQMKGYEQYRKFLDSIISNPDSFINIGQLEIFIKRNIPELYKFRTDSSAVSDEEFASVYGVTEQAAVEHYTNKFRYLKNERRKSRTYKMYRKYVKAPIVTEGIRLDTVMMTSGGDFIYDYVQTLNTCPGLRKAEIALSGDILESGEPILKIPESQRLTFYISSLSSFTDMSERYLTRIISRKAEANTACYVEFTSGSTEIDPQLGNNNTEIGRIKGNLSALASDKDYDLDSIIVTASCSPEGSARFNQALSEKRAASISSYFTKFLEASIDSIRKETGVMMSLDGGPVRKQDNADKIIFISRSSGENWPMLDSMVDRDTLLTSAEKENYCKLRLIGDPDKRENAMSAMPCYKYMRTNMYPRLRTVRFDFFLHRKGMIQDTVRTTVLDTAYMAGVQAIADRDYNKAIAKLRPYHDYNLAVAYCAMDYNASAMEILQSLQETDRVHYMKALLYSRMGEYRTAADHYLTACSMNPSFVHRGNLDPEISALIEMFGLNREEE